MMEIGACKGIAYCNETNRRPHYLQAKNRQPRWHRIVLPLVGAQWRNAMAWTTPTLVEICIGLEINGYLPAEF